MEIGLIISTVILALAVFILLGRLLSLRGSIRETAWELNEKLSEDTNTLISISTGDRQMRALAGKINFQLNELRKERLRLQNGDAELKAAVTNISHDLRTPLTAISGYLDLLKSEENTEKAERYIGVIRERTDAMCALTDELFRYSVITSAAEDLAEEPVNIVSVMEQSLAGIWSTLEDRGITPEINLPKDKVVRIMDAGALRRVFDNVLSNAAKYSDGDIEVCMDTHGTVVFSNSAANLSSVQVERLFDRFYTVEQARSSTGLGLSIARMLTEKMGGSISAKYSGGKLCITLCFPEK